jgi:tetratricopeptide (TPR) repeat protein
MQVARLFNEAAEMSPEDADVHIVLGVLYNLSREYDKAISSFQRALKLKPQDYSLWNKLGATQANSVQSADAILAYQQVYLYATKINCLFRLIRSFFHISQNISTFPEEIMLLFQHIILYF